MPPKRLPNIEDEDFDELFDEDDDYVDEKPTKNNMATILEGSLPEPRFKTVNLRQLHEYIATGNVKLNPEYQRDVVWTEPRQALLVQSLFQNGEEVRVCIDGKQRCTTIQRFIQGDIPFKSDATREKFYYVSKVGQKGGKPLPIALKRKFDNISIQVVEYSDLTLDQQRDIFQRVQLGVPLSAAEKMSALPGRWVQWVHELATKYITEPGTLRDRLQKFDVSRGRPFQNMCSFVMMAYEPDKALKPSAATQTKFLQRTDEPERNFKRNIEQALGIFVMIATDYYEAAFGEEEARVAPVEFFFISLLIYRRMKQMSLDRLANEIARMRRVIREEHRDIRANGKVMDAFYNYIADVVRGKQAGEVSAAEEFQRLGGTASQEIHRTKRRHREEDEDETYHDSGPARGNGSEVVGGLRSKKAPRIEPPPPSYSTQQPPAPVHVFEPPPPAVRPAAIGMDAPAFPPAYNNHHGGSYR